MRGPAGRRRAGPGGGPRPSSTDTHARRVVRRDDPAGKRFGIPGDRGQRGTQLVRHGHEELPLSCFGVRKVRCQRVDGSTHLGHLDGAFGLHDHVPTAGRQRVGRLGGPPQRAGEPASHQKPERGSDSDRDPQRQQYPGHDPADSGQRIRAPLNHDNRTGARRPALDEYGMAVDRPPHRHDPAGAEPRRVDRPDGIPHQVVGEEGDVAAVIERRVLHAQHLEQPASAHLTGLGRSDVRRGPCRVRDAREGPARGRGLGTDDQTDRQGTGHDRRDHGNADGEQRDALAQ